MGAKRLREQRFGGEPSRIPDTDIVQIVKELRKKKKFSLSFTFVLEMLLPTASEEDQTSVLGRISCMLPRRIYCFIDFVKIQYVISFRE